ncbi:preprotein translocase subunit SecG [Phoenicibacter congonensis]|uniref:preprotein translocase subunit SecG n=1 Tax=Phoenicibacter congonensis TaxID=1944646 RepID=UPI0009A5EE21|nr:preprotein translocase subunit SecG [Phoenicibacter congonensis]
MSPIAIILLVLLFLSGTGLVIFILMHSGKGTGISDAIASSMYSSQSGTSIIEKNLDRITIICAVVFIVTLILMMVFFPTGMIQSGN